MLGTATIRVMIVDDHSLVREGLRAVLNLESDIETVGEACSEADLLEKLVECRPDVVLLDIQLPGSHGLEVARRLLRAHPELAVVILTAHDNDLYFLESMMAGASGYLLKGADQELIALAIRTAVRGGVMVDRALQNRAARRLLGSSPPSNGLLAALTPAEQRVLQLIIEGLSNKRIATTLHLAEVTVKKHVGRIISKLGATSRLHAAMLGVQCSGG